MTIMRRSLPALAAIATFLTTALAQDGEPIDILSNHGPFTPTIIFSDTYAEKIISERDGGEVYYDVDTNPQKITAKIVANLAEFDFSEITEEMEVGVDIGGFSFTATLAESGKLDSDGVPLGAFDPAKGKADFHFTAEVEKPNGDYKTKKVGSIVFTWNTSSKLLTIKLTISDVLNAGFEEIGASSFAGFAGSDGETSASLKFENEAVPVSVTFGSAFGERPAYAKGISKTSVKKIGKGDEVDYLTYETVKLVGSADTKAPTLTATIPSSDTDNDGVIRITGAVSDLGRGTISEEVPFLDAYVQIGEGEFTFELLDLSEPNAEGRRTFSLDLSLEDLTNEVKVFAFDESGNVAEITQTVTTAFAF
jgi:hypothetical protein